MKKNLTICTGIGLAMLSGSAQAESSAGDYLNSLSFSPAAGSPWEVTGAASFAVSSGNSDNLSYALQVLATYEEGRNEAVIGADLLYSEADGEATTNSFRLHGQYNRLLSDRLYVALTGSYLTDNIAELDYRFDANLNLGYYMIKNDRTSLAFEVGPGSAWESQGGETSNFATVRFGERFDHQLSRRSKVWQSASLVARADDFNDYFFVGEVGIDTLLNSRWAVRTSFSYQYDSTPAAGRDSDDLTLLTGLSYSLGGFPDPAEAGRQTLKPGDAAPEAIQLGWSSTASLGVAYASGNSDSLAVTLSIDSAYREGLSELFLAANYTLTEDGGDRTTDALRATAQYNRLLNDRLFIGSGVGFLRDEIADVSYRVTPAVTLGYYVVKNDEMTLSFEAGPSPHRSPNEA